MELRKLSQQVLEQNKDKKIICHTMVKDYLRQINREFGVLGNIEYIADDLKQNYGHIEVEGFGYDVIPTEKLTDEDWNTHILVITSEIYWLKYESLSKLLDGRLDVIYYFEDIDTRYYHEYLEKYKDSPLENICVFRSGMRNIKEFPNGDFSDNAKALFDHMIETGLNRTYKLVWIVGTPENYDDYRDVPNVSFVGADWSYTDDADKRDRYYQAVCLGRFFFFTDYASFIRMPRDGQIRVQLWHGNGYKARSFYIPISHECEYAIVTSESTAKTHKAEFMYRDDQVKITGLPKQDWIHHPVPMDFLFDMGLKKNEKYILWLPTFRSTGQGLIVDRDTLHSDTELPLLNTTDKLEKMDALLGEKNISLIIKIHPEQKKPEKTYQYENIFFLDNDDLTVRRLHINQIAGHMDAFISDYSSATTDCSIVDRPMAFALEDYEEYGNKRGFVFDNVLDWLPGELLYRYEDFERFVTEVSEGQDPSAQKRRDVRSRMVKYGDDHNSERVLKMVGIL